MIDTSIVRVHQHGACITKNKRQLMGRSRGGLTSKIHAVVDSNGLPVRLALSPGEAHDVRLAGRLLSRLKSGSMLLADRGDDADWIRELAMKKGASASASALSRRPSIPGRCSANGLLAHASAGCAAVPGLAAASAGRRSIASHSQIGLAGIHGP